MGCKCSSIIRIRTYTCTHTRTHTRVRVRLSLRLHVQIHAHLPVRGCAWAFVRTCVYMSTYTRTCCVYACMRVCIGQITQKNVRFEKKNHRKNREKSRKFQKNSKNSKKNQEKSRKNKKNQE